MNYGEIFYAMRAACRSWEEVARVGAVPTKVIEDLAEDLLALAERDVHTLHCARTALLQRRPLSQLDLSVYATIEVAMMQLIPRHEVVDAAAYDAVLLATMADLAGGPHYIVDLLDLYDLEILVDAIPHLNHRRSQEVERSLRAQALELLQGAVEQKHRRNIIRLSSNPNPKRSHDRGNGDQPPQPPDGAAG